MPAIISEESPAVAVPRLPRSYGRATVAFARIGDGPTRIRTLFQEGCLKLRLPRASRDDAELVLINTAGGLTGGDAISIDVSVEDNACATVTTPGSERIYRSIEGEAIVRQHMTVCSRGRLDWVPQETILFDRARLRRRFDVELEQDAEATIADAVLLGRRAMGETVNSGLLSDFWTVCRDGHMVFADATRIADPFDAAIGNVATLGGYTAFATVIHAGAELEAKRDGLRRHFADAENAVAGASLVGEILVTRIAADGVMALRRALIPALAVLRSARPLPRLWTC